MQSLPLNIKEGDKFVAYDRKTGKKALHGGVCKVVKRYNKKKKTYSPSIAYTKETGRWSSVNAVDAQGDERVFQASHGWGFLKR